RALELVGHPRHLDRLAAVVRLLGRRAVAAVVLALPLGAVLRAARQLGLAVLLAVPLAAAGRHASRADGRARRRGRGVLVLRLLRVLVAAAVRVSVLAGRLGGRGGRALVPAPAAAATG